MNEGDAEQMIELVETPVATSPLPTTARFTRNSLMSVARLLFTTAVGLALPSLLIRRLPVTTYSAWVLILQMSTYITYLDFGIQNGIAKYVAEFQAKNDNAGSDKRASAGLALLLIVSAVGVLLTLAVARQVPELFRTMPPALYRDVRIGIIFVGVSSSFNLLCGIFTSIFMGLQKFAVPTVLGMVNRALFFIAVLTAVVCHGSLATMGAMVAFVNIVTGFLYFAAWRKEARHIRLSLHDLDYGALKILTVYCSSLAVWTVGMLCVNGLDITIVGHYDFQHTGFYAIATAPTSFLVSIIGSALTPLLPAASAMSVHRSPIRMGQTLARMMRYASVLLLVTSLPLLVGGYWLLQVWVGPLYATQILGYMRILILANVLRSMCAPYAIMLIATNSQKFAIASTTCEAIVNLSFSIYLAQRFGAIGVAYGTLIGSFVSVGVHFAISMHYSYARLSIPRLKLFLGGILRPLSIAIPSAVIVPLWWVSGAPLVPIWGWILWALSTGMIAWRGGMNAEERGKLLTMLFHRIGRVTAQGRAQL